MLDNLAREATRGLFFSTWEKMKANVPLEPIENELKIIIQAHSEYHRYLEHPEKYSDYDFNHDSVNPFLHMAMHHALMEQLKTDRPQGLRAIYQKIIKKGLDPHDAEHKIMQVLAEMIWEAVHNHTVPGDTLYLEKLRQLAVEG